MSRPSSTIHRRMKKIKNAYWGGLCILSDFVVLAFFLSLAYFLVTICLWVLSGFAPAGAAEGLSSKIESFVQIGSAVIYAPLVAYYTLRNRMGCDESPDNHESETTDET